MSIIIPIAGGCVAAAVGITAFECSYFYRRTMKRNKAKTERTMKIKRF